MFILYSNFLKLVFNPTCIRYLFSINIFLTLSCATLKADSVVVRVLDSWSRAQRVSLLVI